MVSVSHSFRENCRFYLLGHLVHPEVTPYLTSLFFKRVLERTIENLMTKYEVPRLKIVGTGANGIWLIHYGEGGGGAIIFDL